MMGKQISQGRRTRSGAFSARENGHTEGLIRRRSRVLLHVSRSLTDRHCRGGTAPQIRSLSTLLKNPTLDG
jgi:hypothetical protein